MKQSRVYFSSLFYLLGFIFFSSILIVSCSKDIETMQNKNTLGVEERQQWRSDNIWSPCEASDLVIYVDPCFLTPARADALQALNNAVDEYNNAAGAGINISLEFNSSSPNIDITINCEDSKIEFQGLNGCADINTFDYIAIDTDGPGYSGCDFNICYMTNTIMHELGHILGFGHANDAADGITINGTGVVNVECQCSVMLAGDCNADICEFSAGDLVALQTYYPEISIEGPNVLCAGEKGIYCLKGIEVGPDTKIYWSTNNTSQLGVGQYLSKTIECHTVSYNEPGTYTLSALVIHNGWSCSFFKTITVDPREDCKDCFCVCLLEDQWGNVDYYEEAIDCSEKDCSSIEDKGNIGNYYIEYCRKEVRIKD